MDSIEEILNEVNLKKRGLSLIMDDQNVMPNDIMNTFYHLTQDIENLGVQYFHLDAYHVVFGDFILNIQYTIDDRTYYIMIGANSKLSPPQQIAVGTAIGDKIYMMCESVSSTSSIDLIAFPKFAINQRTKGFILKSYRDTIHLFFTRSMASSLADESKKCLESGFEAMDVFCKLINQVKNQNKRKKLNI